MSTLMNLNTNTLGIKKDSRIFTPWPHTHHPSNPCSLCQGWMAQGRGQSTATCNLKIPMYLSKYFMNVNEVHNHYTRGSSTDHVQPRFGTNKGLNSFSCYATKMWNALPKVVKECKTLLSFKSALKVYLQEAATRNWPL